MTFDEAIKKSRTDFIYDDNVWGVWTNLLEELKEEYAPTVEMTKTQHEAFVESVEGIATQEQLDSFVDEELDLGYMTVRKGLNAWLHPETIKIVDE